MSNIRSELMPDHKIFKLSNGQQFGAHKHSCLFCEHCTDIFWDYENGIYGIICNKYLNDTERMTEHIKLSFSGKCKSFKEE